MELLVSVRSHESGTLNSARCKLDGALTLGRGPDSPLVLDGTGISREHLRLHSEGKRIFITDLSSNGTWLNARRLARGEPHPITPDDAIKIPGFEIRIDMNYGSPTGVRPPMSSAAVVSKAASEGQRAAGILQFVRGFGASLSSLERFLIALGLATLVLLLLYLAAHA